MTSTYNRNLRVCDILNKATLAIGMSCALIKITAIHNIDPIPSLNNRTGKFAYVLLLQHILFYMSITLCRSELLKCTMYKSRNLQN